MSNQQPTLTIQGFTPYAQIPKWILRSGGELSHGAVRLYGVLMTYADNETKTAFPARDKLGDDLGVKEWSISKYIKELEAFGAITVLRRRNQKTGNFYANQYTLIFSEPSVENPTRPDVQDHTVTTPTSLTRSTSYVTSEETSDNEFHAHTECEAPKNHPLPVNHYIETKKLLTHVGQAIQETGSFHSDEAQEAWDTFTDTLVACTEHLSYQHALADLLLNGKWTVTADVADDYRAGKEMTTMLNTARKQDG